MVLACCLLFWNWEIQMYFSTFVPKVFLIQKFFWSKSSFGPKVLLIQKFFWFAQTIYILGRCGIGHVFVPITSQGKQTFQVISDQQVFHILKSKKNKLGELGRWVYFAKIHSQKYTLAKLEGLHCKYLWNESCRSYLILYELIYDIWKEILLKLEV